MVITDMSELGYTRSRVDGAPRTRTDPDRARRPRGRRRHVHLQLENGKQSAEAGKVIDVLLTLGIDLIAERRA